MQTIEKTIYEFSELEDSAKERVRQWIYEGLDYIASEVRPSLDKFCDHFDIKWSQIDYEEPYRNEYRVNVPEYAEDLTGVRLATYLYNNYLKYLYKGKYFSTSGKYIDGKYHYKKKYSNWYKTIDCPFTGVCYDYDLLQPLLDFCNKPNSSDTFESLMDDCISNLCKSVQNEIKWRLEDEQIQKHCQANEYMFDEDGNFYI